jgi:addiction module HigA family antidote
MPPAPHPGEILAEHLAAAGISPTEFSRQIAVPPNRITQILHAQRAITADTALRLAHWFATTPEFWLTLQSAYDLRLARERAGPAIARLPTR